MCSIQEMARNGTAHCKFSTEYLQMCLPVGYSAIKSLTLHEICSLKHNFIFYILKTLNLASV